MNQEVQRKLSAYIPIKWRVQSTTEYKAICVCYIDGRDVMKRLDEVFGITGWQRDHKEVKGRMYAGIGVLDKETNQWVWKWDAGTESNQDKEKGEASDSFKRAGVNLDIGRFMYDLPIVELPVSKKSGKYRASREKDNERSIFWTGEALTNYINANLSKLTGISQMELDRLMNKPEYYAAENSAIANVINAGIMQCKEPEDFQFVRSMLAACPKEIAKRLSGAFKQRMNLCKIKFIEGTYKKSA